VSDLGELDLRFVAGMRFVPIERHSFPALCASSLAPKAHDDGILGCAF
jgi:hypothetical protein